MQTEGIIRELLNTVINLTKILTSVEIKAQLRGSIFFFNFHHLVILKKRTYKASLKISREGV